MSAINPNVATIISPQLKADISSGRKPSSTLDDNEFDRLRGVTLAQMESTTSNNDYHNRDHIESVLKAVESIINHLSQKLEKRERLVLKLAALFHDFEHPGLTIRSEVERDMPHKDLSNEEYAVLKADEALRDHLTVQERIDLQGLILATTFGQPDKPYTPTTRLEKLLAFADIANFSDGFDIWMEDNLNVLREVDKSKRPNSLESFVKARFGFIGYVESKLNEIEEFITPDYASKLRVNLEAMKINLNDSSVMAKYAEELNTLLA